MALHLPSAAADRISQRGEKRRMEHTLTAFEPRAVQHPDPNVCVKRDEAAASH
jgi:hypothetical protein